MATRVAQSRNSAVLPTSLSVLFKQFERVSSLYVNWMSTDAHHTIILVLKIMYMFPKLDNSPHI